MMFFSAPQGPSSGGEAGNRKVTQERIAAELHTLAQHQKVLMELDQVLRRIGTERGWSRPRLTAELIELEQRIKRLNSRCKCCSENQPQTMTYDFPHLFWKCQENFWLLVQTLCYFRRGWLRGRLLRAGGKGTSTPLPCHLARRGISGLSASICRL